MKTTKKALAIFMILLTVFSTLPLNGLVNTKANAAEAQKTEYFNETMFLTEVWSNRTGNYGESEKLITYFSDETISPCGILVEDLLKNKSISGKFYKFVKTISDPASWSSKAFNPENYCELVILEAINVSLGDKKNLAGYDTQALEYSKEITNAISESLGSYSTLKKLKFNDKKDLKKFTDAFKKTKFGKVEGALDFLNEAVGYVVDFTQLIDKLSKFAVLSDIDSDLQYCLNYLYKICPSNTAMKNALGTITLCFEDFMGGMLAATYKAFETAANWQFSFAIGEGIKTLSEAVPVVAAIFKGLKLGVLCCNVLFNSDAVNEQIYILERVYEFENLVKKCMKNLKTTYKNTPNETNATHYKASVSLFFNTIADVNCDATIKFYDNLYNRGLVDYLRNGFGRHDGAEGPKSSLNDMKSTRQKAYTDLLKLDGHRYTMSLTRATLNKNGKKIIKCSDCSRNSTETIPSIKSVTLSKTQYVYTGNNKTPKATLKDSKGKTLVKNVDYQVSAAKNRSGIGRHTVKVTFIGNYYGSQTLYFYVKPWKPTQIESISQNESSIKLSWNKVLGATGYTVYRYSPSKKDYVKSGTTSGTTATIKNLYSGTKYTFRVVAYGKSSKGNIYHSESYASIKTATAPSYTNKITVTQKGSDYINIKWDSVKGATAYRVFYRDEQAKKWSISISGTTNLFATVKNLVPGKKYTIAVKAYIQTDSGTVWANKYTIATAKTSDFNEKYARNLLSKASEAYLKWGLDIYSIVNTNDCIYLDTKYGSWPYYAVKTGDKTIKDIENRLSVYFDKALSEKIVKNADYVEYKGKLYVARVNGLGDLGFHYTDTLQKKSATHYRYNLKAWEFYDNSFVFDVSYDIIYENGNWIFTERYDNEHTDMIKGFRLISNPEDIR